MFVFDGHSDLLTDITSRRINGEKNIFQTRHYHKLIKGGVNAVIAVVWIDPPYDSNPPARMMEIIKNGYAELYPLNDVVFPIKNANELDLAIENNKIGIILGMEGLSGLEDDPEGLYFLYELGLRHASLTWNEANSFATGVRANRENKGLTSAGKRAVKIMEELGIIIDVSHADEKTFWDIVDVTSVPIIASHSNAYNLCPVNRNLKDDQVKAIANSGGIVGVNCWPEFVDKENPSLSKLVDHIDYLVNLAGVDHVAFGFDFTDFLEDTAVSSFKTGDTVITPGINSATEIPNIIKALQARGYSNQDLEKICYKNLRDLFRIITTK